MKLQDLVKGFKLRLDREIEAELARRLAEVTEISPHLTPVVTAMQELSAGGKRMRGLLTILGYKLAGGLSKHEEMVVRAGVVMELFHLGLLIHDDFMDQDSLRRGVATIQSRYSDRHLGESMAVLAGDYTFGWGVEILSGLKMPKERVLAAMQVWGKYFTRVGYGQTLDVLKSADEASLLAILALKSGEYSCVLPLQLGAALAGGSHEITKMLYQYGMELGWVFQLRDDYLSEWGDSSKTGKPVGNDRREDKHSFALMYGQEKLLEEITRHVELGKECLRGHTNQEAEILREILDWMATREN